jgi:hypothetical protein
MDFPQTYDPALAALAAANRAGTPEEAVENVYLAIRLVGPARQAPGWLEPWPLTVAFADKGEEAIEGIASRWPDYFAAWQITGDFPWIW